MNHPRLHFVAMLIFVVGFVAAGSGWMPLLNSTQRNRPSWSICGQEMCSCLPTEITQPLCPLCETTELQSDHDDTTVKTDNPKRLPKDSHLDDARFASQAGCASLFLGFLFGARMQCAAVSQVSIRYAIDQSTQPCGPPHEIPTPPPRC